jgi:fructose-bisphosphate aldolase class II
MRRYLAAHPDDFDPRKPLKEAMLAAKGLCKERFEQFGCAGQAPRVKPVPLDAMADRYARGELDPVVH